jgi:hypothetical protein
MVKKYTDEQVLDEYKKWIEGTIVRRTTPVREWSAMKRRINRAGLTKRPSDFKASAKGKSQEDWKRDRARVARENKISKIKDSIVAVASKHVQPRPAT